jgi:hypothetical protein
VGSCLKVFYKKSFLKQYNKGGRVLRIEVCVNDPRDVSLVHLDDLGTIAYHAITRFQKAQAVAVTTALGRSTFERLTTPSTPEGQRVAGLRFGAPRAMRLLEALGCAGLTFKAFSQADLRDVLLDRLGAAPADCTPARLGYDLTKLRGKGLVRRVPERNLYTLTDLGSRSTGPSCTTGSSPPSWTVSSPPGVRPWRRPPIRWIAPSPSSTPASITSPRSRA